MTRNFQNQRRQTEPLKPHRVGLMLSLVAAVRSIQYWQKHIGESKKSETTLKKAINNCENERLQQKSFVATFSHDLRNPLLAAKTYAEYLLKFPDGNENTQAIARKILDCLQRSDFMIQDLLDSTRMQSSESILVQKGSCDLRDLAQQVVEEMQLIHGKRFQITGDSSVYGYWSCNSLRRVIENLCSNAVKYGCKTSMITVSLAKRDTLITISVHNAGNPIPMVEQKKLFKRFHRSNAKETSTQIGWGLGLCLVKEIVEAHEGTIHVTSSAEAGTTFTVTLPVRTPQGLSASA